MSRWSGVCALITVTETMDDQGNPVETTSQRAAYCNDLRIGLGSWSEAHAAGLTADARIQVREESYDGQQRVLYKGTEYEVEQASSANGFATLTLKRLASTAQPVEGAPDGE